MRHLSPPAYTIRYDNHDFNDSVQVFSEADKESFHGFLDEKYGSVEKLNNAWGTSYSSFSDAGPIELDEAKQSNALTRWADTMFFQIDRYTQEHSFAHDIISAVDSTVQVGINCFQTVRNAYNGYDIHRIFNNFDAFISVQDAETMMNGDFAITDALSSYTDTTSLKGLIIKGDIRSLSNENFLRSTPWQSLFSGMNSIWWDKLSGSAGSALNPDFSISPLFSIVAEESKEITDGIDLLLLGSTLHRDSIGILYSPGSIIAANTFPEHEITSVISTGTGMTAESSNIAMKSARSFLHACKELGYAPVFITEDEVKGNVLLDEGYSVLFLPCSRVISSDIVKVLKEFTRGGGTIIADVRPAVMGEDFSMRDTGALDEIFGISGRIGRTATQEDGTISTMEIIKGGVASSGLTIPDCAGYSAVTVNGDVLVRGRIGDYPALIENNFGKGKGIFLNTGMEIYGKIRFKEKERGILLDIISKYIETSGIEKPFVNIQDRKGNNAAGVYCSVFDDGSGKYIGILADPGLLPEKPQLPEEYMLKIDFAEKIYYGYNVRKGKFIGALSDIPTELSPVRPELYAMLPYRVKNLTVEIKESVVRPGDKVEYNVKIIPQGKNTKTGRHVIRVRVIDPEGNEQRKFSYSYEFFDGNFESSFWISRQNPPGRWILSVRDIATGKRAERAFMIMSDEKMILK